MLFFEIHVEAKKSTTFYSKAFKREKYMLLEIKEV
jgi:hypothetical protein